MIIVKTAQKIGALLGGQNEFSNQIGFVPTMGALHEGHLELVKAAKKKCRQVVVSIFVNPTQFNDPKDFEQYPISIEQDIRMLEKAGADMLLLPSVAAVYPAGTASSFEYQLGKLEHWFEGKWRPGHFKGVCQVVHRLLDWVKPGLLFMGQKDYQQCMVVQALIHQLQWPIALQIVPTVREKSGLAMSSRNRRLSDEQLTQASTLYAQMSQIARLAYHQPLPQLVANATAALQQAGFKPIDYVAIADAQTLEPLTMVPGNRQMVVLVAAFLQNVRLIDNLLIPLPLPPSK